MKISKLPPPIAVATRALHQFKVDFENDDVAFAYGDTVHVASGILAPDVEVHEQVHLNQQAEHEGGAAGWWDDYFKDPEFRISQEVAAYKAQYHYIWRNVRDRNRLHASLHKLASYLSGPMYGKMVSMGEAMQLIRGTKTYVSPNKKANDDEDEG